MAAKRKIKPASATPTRPAWRVTSAHLPVTGGRAVVYSAAGCYEWRTPNGGAGVEGDLPDRMRSPALEAACRAAVRALPDAERRRILASDPQWIITGAIMELRGAAARRLSVHLIGDVVEWRAINEGRVADSGADDSVSRCQDAAEKWARENGWMCPDCGGPMHQCKTGDAGCFHCDNDKCGGAVAPRRGE